MKLFGIIAVLILLAALWLCIWKMLEPNKSVADILKEVKSIFTDNTTQPPSVPLYSSLYPLFGQYRVEYEDFTASVWDCLDKLNSKLHLSVPTNCAKLYAPDVADRVRIVARNCLIFVYEVRAEPMMYGERMTDRSRTATYSAIETALRENLPSYMWGGYYYTGPVYVKDIGDGRIRIEVTGINRLIPNPNAGGVMI